MDSEGLDQTAHPRSLIRGLRCTHTEAFDIADCIDKYDKPDRTRNMRRLSMVFAIRLQNQLILQNSLTNIKGYDMTVDLQADLAFGFRF